MGVANPTGDLRRDFSRPEGWAQYVVAKSRPKLSAGQRGKMPPPDHHPQMFGRRWSRLAEDETGAMAPRTVVVKANAPLGIRLQDEIDAMVRTQL